MKQSTLKSLKSGDTVAHLFRISNVELRKAKNGPYLSFTAGDRETEVQARKWESSEEEYTRFKACKHAYITGKLETYKDIMQLKADTIAVPDVSEEDAKDLIPEAPVFARPDFKAQIPLKEIKENGQVISHLLRISSLELRPSKNGSAFLAFKLGDSTKDLNGKKWGSNPEELEKFKNAKVVYVNGKVESYNGGMSIVADSLDLPGPEVTDDVINTLYKVGVYDIKFLKKEIWGFVQKMKNPWIKKICENILTDPRTKEKFSLVPAGVGRHHNRRHGLAEHIYRLLLIANDFVDSYNKHMYPGSKVQINKDLVMAGALLHDYYKTDEYEVDGSYALRGNLLAHISRGIMEIGSKTAQIPNFPDEIKEQLAAIISSHHGQTNWGSPDTPCTAEQLIVHHLDNLCSKVDPVVEAVDELEENQDWTTERVRAIEKQAYRGGMIMDKYQ